MSSENDLNVVRQPACLHLLSKGMFVTGTINPIEQDAEIGDGYCWCAQTQGRLGPDSQFVDRAGCNSERTCYQSRIM